MADFPRLSRTPLQYPRYLFVGYLLMLSLNALIAVVAEASLARVLAVLFAAGFSFQFFVYATWRGLQHWYQEEVSSG